MSPAVPSDDRLDSWKAIAAYLDRQVRSVQRWEKEEGLPVHRLPHKKQGTVYALKSELDAWRRRSPALLAVPAGEQAPRPPRRLGRWSRLAVVVVVAMAAGVGLWLWWPRSGPPRPASAPAWDRLLAQATRAGGAPRTLTLGPAPRYAAISPDGHTLYVGDEADGSVHLVDTVAPRVQGVLRLGGAVGALMLAADGGHLFVAQRDESRLQVVDTHARTWYSLALPGVASDMALSRDGDRLFLAMKYAGLAVLDTNTLRVRHLTGHDCPSNFAPGGDGRQLYIVSQCGDSGGRSGHDAIGIWDEAQQRLVGRLAGPPQVGSRLAVSSDGGELWAGRGDACGSPAEDHESCAPNQVGGLDIYSLDQRRLLRSLALPYPPGRIAFVPGDARVVVSGGGVTVFDTTRLAAMEGAALPSPGDAVVAPDGAHIYVTMPARHAVAIFDASAAGCDPPREAMLGWWRGDGTAADAWGLSHGQWVGSPGYAPGLVGGALAFSGTNAVVAGHDAVLATGSTLGLAAWVKPAAGGGRAVLLGKFNPETGNGWQLRRLADGRLSFCTGSGSAGGCGMTSATRLDAPRALPEGAWHQVAVTVTAGHAKMVLDGRTVAQTQLNMSHSHDLRATLKLGGPGWRGLMDEVMLFSQLPPATLGRLAAMPACYAGRATAN